MLEIAAQVEHDRDFRQLLSTVHNGDIIRFICNEKRRIESVQAERHRQHHAAEQQAALCKLQLEQVRLLDEKASCWQTQHTDRSACIEESGWPLSRFWSL
jgi:hypothetical protein